MRTSVARAEKKRPRILETPHQEVRILSCTIPKEHFKQPWEKLLDDAGLLDDAAGGLCDPYLNVQTEMVPDKDRVLYLMSFGRFRCSKPVEHYAADRGYVPAHPQSLAIFGNLMPDFPEQLNVPRPLSLVSLFPCYRDEGETHVMEISWHQDGLRAVRGSFYHYGWAAHCWMAFEKAKP